MATSKLHMSPAMQTHACPLAYMYNGTVRLAPCLRTVPARARAWQQAGSAGPATNMSRWQRHCATNNGRLMCVHCALWPLVTLPGPRCFAITVFVCTCDCIRHRYRTHSCASLRPSLASLNHTVSTCSRAPRRTKAVSDARSSRGEGRRCCCCPCCCCSLWPGSWPSVIRRWVVRLSCSCRPLRQVARTAFRSSGCRWAQAMDAPRRRASGDTQRAAAGPALSTGAPSCHRSAAQTCLSVYLILTARGYGVVQQATHTQGSGKQQGKGQSPQLGRCAFTRTLYTRCAASYTGLQQSVAKRKLLAAFRRSRCGVAKDSNDTGNSHHVRSYCKEVV